MKFDTTNMQNFDIHKSMKYLIFISFIVQWSFLSMIINLFTMGLFRFPLFILLILDALTILLKKNKTIKRPSLILSFIWDLIDLISNGKSKSNYNTNNNFIEKSESLSKSIRKKTEKIKNTINNFKSNNLSRKKYNTERKLNEFSDEIGKKITIEYTSPDKKMNKKSFKYKDRATTFINSLESNGYKNFTKYNLDLNTSSTYIIFNKNKDIIDVSSNKIQLKKDDKDYKFVTKGWPI